MARLGSTPVSITGTESGVEKSWYYTDVNGGGMGLAGAIAGVIVTEIANSVPSARAERQASEIAEVITPEKLNSSMVAQFKSAVAPPPAGPVTLRGPVITQKTVTPGPLDGVIEITTTYTLSEDSSVLRVISVATYANAAIPYQSRYKFEKTVPESEKSGPLYRNEFTYYSTPLPVPVLTPELKARLVASVRDSARDHNGALPAEGTSAAATLKHNIELAQDDHLTGGEMSVFLTREWLKDGGAPLMREIESAHAFVAKYVLLDLNRSAVPSLTGTDELLETSANDRTVRRIGSGVMAGSYVASAANVTAAATYGNTAAVGKATVAYVKGLKPPGKGS